MKAMFAVLLISSSGLYGLDELASEWRPLPVQLGREIRVLGVSTNMGSVVVEAPNESRRYVLSFVSHRESITARWSPGIPKSAEEVLDAANEHGLVAVRSGSRVFVLRQAADAWTEIALPYHGSAVSFHRAAFSRDGRDVCVAFVRRAGVNSYSVDTRVYRLSQTAKVVYRRDGEPEYTSILPNADGWTMGSDTGQFSIVLRDGAYKRVGVSEHRPVPVPETWAGSQPYLGAGAGVFHNNRLLSPRPTPDASPITVLPSGRVLWQINRSEGLSNEGLAERPLTCGLFLNERAIAGPRVGSAVLVSGP